MDLMVTDPSSVEALLPLVVIEAEAIPSLALVLPWVASLVKVAIPSSA